ncbi:hypothetical protein [Pelomonas sp. SE-A7]|uniref:hypothetical protein n=1 Tax=Pelomonas sp. SE-A7 TaxID=3054953 RepID=UPI00259C78A1|nr:hypothetical protein [Pelomonas sp. SE-A7]MDM4767402.1 hypothetical protein [Pelomonas sp. SE-A7]
MNAVRLLLIPLLMLAAGAAMSRPADPGADERAQLRQQQRELEAAHAEKLAECGKRFEVNRCRAQANAEYKQKLHPIQAREREMDEQARQHRALVQELRSSARQDPPAAGPGARASLPAKASSEAGLKQVRSGQQAHAQRKVEQAEKEALQAAERARQTELRKARLAEHARDVEQRNARRDGKKGVPLPVPTAASIAALPAQPASR